MFQILSAFYLEIWSHLFWKQVLLIINLGSLSTPSPYTTIREVLFVWCSIHITVSLYLQELCEKLLFDDNIWWILPFSLISYPGSLCIEKKDCRLFCPKKVICRIILEPQILSLEGSSGACLVQPPASRGWASMGTLGTVSQCCSSEEGFLIIPLSFMCSQFTFNFISHTVIFLAYLDVRKKWGGKTDTYHLVFQKTVSWEFLEKKKKR